MALWRRRLLQRRFEVRSSERVIVALDVATAQQAIRLVKQLGDQASHYKVGLQLLTAAGPLVVRELVAMGKQVFLDLKLFEVPNSAFNQVRADSPAGAMRAGATHVVVGRSIIRADNPADASAHKQS